MADVASPDATFLAVQGRRVYCQRRGAGPPLLVLHGEDAASRWLPFHDALSGAFDVRLPDHPGFGQSEPPPFLRGMPDMVYCYLDLLDALDLKQVDLVGESFGGWVAAALAVAQPARVRRLVLLGPAGVKPRGLSIPDVFALSHEQLAAVQYHDEAIRAAVAAARPDRPARERQLQDRATLARLAWNPLLHDPQLPHWLHRIRVPTLLVWGAEDRFLPPSIANLWLENLPDARLVTVPGAGHLPQVEQPEHTARVVLDFLQGA